MSETAMSGWTMLLEALLGGGHTPVHSRPPRHERVHPTALRRAAGVAAAEPRTSIRDREPAIANQRNGVTREPRSREPRPRPRTHRVAPPHRPRRRRGPRSQPPTSHGAEAPSRDAPSRA